MELVSKPQERPENPNFSSGPCAKRPGWSISSLENSVTGRSHRSKDAKNKIAEVIKLSKKILKLPDDYLIGIIPASDTGAFETAMWSLLGPNKVDVLAWESFGLGWVNDIVKQLKIKNVDVFIADYGELPDLSNINSDNDIVFTWNGTTSGVCVPDGEWISENRKGLTFCDATSAVFSIDIPWNKIDIATYSWQKVLGGEAGHGMLILSPRAIDRLNTYQPTWPIPKIFRITKNNKINEGIFKGDTINTPSMICVEDALDGLKWSESIGGLDALIKRSKDNFSVIEKWVNKTNWVEFLAKEQLFRSTTSVCLKIVDKNFSNLDLIKKNQIIHNMCKLLEDENVAFDINSYRDAPPGIRVWCGSTINKHDIQKLLPWLVWAYQKTIKIEEI
ncbi:phosphoserine transaminase [Alphaproteobacteria bacterium]|nr:phosphoserine transaminase [Alphaproteobacteria bacterium]